MASRSLTEGMYWHSPDSSVALAERIGEAISFYRNKYGEPNMVMMHPDTVEEGLELDGLQIVKSGAVQPDHFWIGQFEGEAA